MNRPEMKTAENDSCPPEEDLLALCLGEEDGIDPERIRVHLAECPDCRDAIAGFESVVATLRKGDISEREADLSARIAKKVIEIEGEEDDLKAFPFRPWARVFKYAAAVLLFVALGSAVWQISDRQEANPHLAAGEEPVDGALRRGAQWLMEQQQAQGGWSVAVLGGQPRYEPALNGLAILALLRSGEGGAPVAAASRAVDKLLLLQDENGRFGSAFDRALYNHGIATMAVLTAYELTGRDDLRPAIDQALAYTRATQSYTGGWGYQTGASAAPNSSVTAWQIQSLMLAEKLGWRDSRNSLRNALDWVSRRVDQSGHFSYSSVGVAPEDESDTVTMMGAYCLLAAVENDIPIRPELKNLLLDSVEELSRETPRDYYSAFCYSSALAASADGNSTRAGQKIREHLIERQTDGEWLPDDRWGAVGGRIYSTAMSLLALRP